MVNSMTGFGRGEYGDNDVHATVEIRSVNHRFREITVRIPRVYLSLEEKIKKQVEEKVARGHLDIFVKIEDHREKKRNVKLDKELLLAYDKSLREMAEMLDIELELDVACFSGFPDVLVVEEKEGDVDDVWKVVQVSLREAVEQLLEMRAREGAKLYEDLMFRRNSVCSFLEEIREREPQLSEELRIRLKNKLQQLLEEHEIDEALLANEVILFAERSSITEEVVRLASHLDQLEEILQSGEPAGRSIEFLIQEMNREINTIGSKASDRVISPLVVKVKSEIEKMREQAQNIE
ncbi:MAG TPA: YicC family protein [Syntrophomonadaceae bacterium]|nr:YicC family protein [Syntrophomonadaceae bacterium]